MDNKNCVIKHIVDIALFMILFSSITYGQDSLRYALADSVYIIEQPQGNSAITISNRTVDPPALLTSLETESFATVRSGGPAVLSTLIHRGMASRHVAVLWGGFNIQSVVNGTFDLSLIRNSFDRVKFYQSGTTAMTGNASMAGALSLQNRLFSSNRTTFAIQASNTNNFSYALRNKWTSGKYSHHIMLHRTTDGNEYQYLNGGQEFTQTNAQFSMWSLNYEGKLMVSDRLVLGGGVWLQDADRNIPPTKTSVPILQDQQDQNYRTFLSGTLFLNPAQKLHFRGAYFDEILEYQAPGTSSLADTRVLNGAINYVHDAGFVLRVQYRHDRVEASFFDPIYTRATYGVVTDYSKQWKSTNFGLSFRPEWVNGVIQPLTISLRTTTTLTDQIEIDARYNKGYTLPSFNDLYWPSGGNPDLKTERSHEFNLGAKYSYGVEKDKMIQLTVFLNLIDDWIQWTPIEVNFQPVNQRKVRNLGLEATLQEHYQIKNGGQLGLRLMYTLTDSRLARHYLNTVNEGKRSIFVPLHKMTGQISWTYRSWETHVRPTYYSKRYNTVDNSTFTSGFLIADIEIVRKIQLKSLNAVISLTVENSFNNDYENIRFFPMPLRFYRMGLNINI